MLTCKCRTYSSTPRWMHGMYTYIQMLDRRLLLGLLCALGRLNFGVGLSRPLRGDLPLPIPLKKQHLFI